MKQLLSKMCLLPKWYGIIVIIIFALLTAEYSNSFFKFSLIDPDQISFLRLLKRLGYITSIAATLVFWVIVAYIIHLTVQLFDADESFNKLLFSSAFCYIVPALGMLFAILILDGIIIPEGEDQISYLANNNDFKLMTIVLQVTNYFIYPQFIVLVKYIYSLNWIKSILSVVCPFLLIIGLSQLIEFII